MPQHLTDHKSTLVQVMAWCHQTTSLYLSMIDLDPCLHMTSLGHNELTEIYLCIYVYLYFEVVTLIIGLGPFKCNLLFFWPFARRMHQWPVDIPHKRPVVQEALPIIMSPCKDTLLHQWKVVTCRSRKISWWRHQMETFSALLVICAGNSSVTGEFPTQRPVTWSFDVFFDLCLNKQLSTQSWGWWFEMPLHPLWRHCSNVWISCIMSDQARRQYRKAAPNSIVNIDRLKLHSSITAISAFESV